MNHVLLSGRLTKDPDIRYTGDQRAVANFTLAVDRWGKGTDFIRVAAFDKRAEFIEKYCVKGQKITIHGRIAVSDYEDREGNRRQDIKVIADEVEPNEWKKTEKHEEKHEERQEEKQEELFGFEEFAAIDESIPF